MDTNNKKSLKPINDYVIPIQKYNLKKIELKQDQKQAWITLCYSSTQTLSY